MRFKASATSRLFTTLLTLLGFGVVGVWAAPPDDGKQPEKPADKPAEKRVAFTMDGKPWGEVLTWLTELTGLPISGPHKPTGTIVFTPPKGKTYTIPEIIDILNEGLLLQKYVLIRRMQSFTLLPADEPIDPVILQRLDVKELKDHGNTEIV